MNTYKLTGKLYGLRTAVSRLSSFGHGLRSWKLSCMKTVENSIVVSADSPKVVGVKGKEQKSTSCIMI